MQIDFFFSAPFQYGLLVMIVIFWGGAVYLTLYSINYLGFIERNPISRRSQTLSAIINVVAFVMLAVSIYEATLINYYVLTILLSGILIAVVSVKAYDFFGDLYGILARPK
jgi:hypothetical protein